jgi:hypothetical protein
MTDLSPAAQAVLTAFGKYPLHGDHIADTLMYGALPAALRAVADQLQMDEALGDTDADVGVFVAHHAICAHLLAIADELEGAVR